MHDYGVVSVYRMEPHLSVIRLWTPSTGRNRKQCEKVARQLKSLYPQEVERRLLDVMVLEEFVFDRRCP